MIFAEITFCPSINLEQSVMALVLFSYLLAAKLRNALPYFSVPMSLLVVKENSGPHFVQWLFFLMNLSLNIMYLVCICTCYAF